MPLSAVALALGAAFLHAGWNVLLAGSRDTRRSTAGLLIWGVVLLALPAVVTGGVSSEAIPYIAASAVFELCYFVLLARAYDSGEVSVVYPASPPAGRSTLHGGTRHQARARRRTAARGRTYAKLRSPRPFT